MKSVLLLVAAISAAWAWRIRTYIRPEYETQTVETRTLKARYPVDWEKIDVTDPRLGDKTIVFISDEPHAKLDLQDLGTAHPSADGENLRLDNGVTAKTWVAVEPLSPDRPVEIRHFVFAGTNRHAYEASYLVPADWKRRRRYAFIFERILGSIEFKTPSS